MSEHPRFRLIGDPHITRKFEVGVPLARRGEREESLFRDFQKRLWEGDEKWIVCVGDLFEKPICSIQDLNRTIDIILSAAQTQPDRQIVVMAGNHDISPQSGFSGAFDILETLDDLVENLHILKVPCVMDRIAFFPWEWERTAEEQLSCVRDQSFDVAVGHWDLSIYDPMHTEHLCPAKKLTEMGAKEIYSGHWHIAGDYVVDGVTVHCTGSMQPMTHAEDPDGKLYVTMTLAEYEDADPQTLKDKYVRVLADVDDEVETLDDCLGFKVQRKTSDGDWDGSAVKMEEFKVEDVVTKQLEKHDVPKEVASFIKERLDATD